MESKLHREASFMSNYYAVAQKILTLSVQLEEATKSSSVDLFLVSSLAGQIVRMSQALQVTTIQERKTMARFPHVLLLHIASFNLCPSLRCLGQTCKSWRGWAHSLRGANSVTRVLYHAPVPLLEFAWVDQPRSIPSYVVKESHTCLTVRETEGISYRNQILTHHVDVHRGLRSGSRVLTEMAHVLHAHLTTTHLYLLTAKGPTSERVSNLMCVPRDVSDASTFQFDASTRVRWPESSRERKITVCAWSDDSVFALFKCDAAAEVVEYDLQSCTEKSHVDVSDFLDSTTGHNQHLYMGWFSGVLLFGIASLSSVRCHYVLNQTVQLVLLEWKTRTTITLPKRPCPANCLMATLQLHGSSLVYLSLGNPLSGTKQVNIWDSKHIKRWRRGIETI
jgi:hypothetical protein